MKKILLFSVLSLFFSGCLKTRTQVVQDEGITSGVSPVQDAKPNESYVIDELKSEITRLTGRIDDLERSQAAANGNQNATLATKEEMKRLEARIIEIEQAQLNILEQMKRPAPAPVDSNALFEKGKSLLDAKQYQEAVQMFSEYLKTPNPKFADAASFYRGESHFMLKEYKKAIVDYSKITEKYPNSKRMPEALYKIGASFEALGLKEDAKAFFQELVAKYPKSVLAKKIAKKAK